MILYVRWVVWCGIWLLNYPPDKKINVVVRQASRKKAGQATMTLSFAASCVAGGCCSYKPVAPNGAMTCFEC